MSVVGNMTASAKVLIDVTSIGTAIAAVIGLIPTATAVLGFVWFLMRMYQTWQEIKINRRRLAGDTPSTPDS